PLGRDDAYHSVAGSGTGADVEVAGCDRRAIGERCRGKRQHRAEAQKKLFPHGIVLPAVVGQRPVLHEPWRRQSEPTSGGSASDADSFRRIALATGGTRAGTM